ncbi:MAG: type I-E CRISPR-associated protein Cas6/Cse3/CasE [Pseudomonadota bacterium]
MSKIELNMYRASHDTIYDIHQALWKVYSDYDDRKRDFIYRQIGPSSFLTVSHREPHSLQYIASLHTKEYTPVLQEGQKVHFALRFNPVVKRRDTNGKQVRIDIVQDERKRRLCEGVLQADLPQRTEIAMDVAPKWLSSHIPSLDIDASSLVVEAYRLEKFRKKKGDSLLTIASMDVQGTAFVRDVATLEKALYNGVGCAKGFGLGLLLLRKG